MCLAWKMSSDFFYIGKIRMSKEVEIFKIGTILYGNKILLVVRNGGPIIDCYVNILKEKCGSEYTYIMTEKSICGTIENFKGSSLLGLARVNSIKGIERHQPIIGIGYFVGDWSTLTVKNIVDDNILLTDFAVYVIHDISKVRDWRIKNELEL